MIVVDTSVWVSALRSGSGPDAKSLSRLLDEDHVALAAPVRIEILSGASRRDYPVLRRLLSALPVWFPERTTWDLAESWTKLASGAGEQFGVADLLIGALATERQAEIWSLDRDFERLARLGLVELFKAEV